MGCAGERKNANTMVKEITTSICISFADSKTGYKKEFEYDSDEKWIKEPNINDGSIIKENMNESKYDKHGNCTWMFVYGWR